MKKQWLIVLLTLALACAGNVVFAQAETTPVTAETTENPDNKANETTDEVTRFVLAPSGISKDSKGRMYIADRTYHVVRLRTKNGVYKVLAGIEGKSGYKNGNAKSALFCGPWDVVAYNGGWLISDSGNHALRLYKNGKVTTVAGNGKSGYKNATGKKAQFNRPTGMAAGKNGEVYVSDTENNVIRKIDKNGKVTTYAGGRAGCADGTLKTAKFYEPTGLFYYKGDKNGSALKARLSNPQDIFLYKNVMYISDTGNACVRKLSKGRLTTLITAFSMGDGRAPAEPVALNRQGGSLYVGDIFTEELLEIKL